MESCINLLPRSNTGVVVEAAHSIGSLLAVEKLTTLNIILVTVLNILLVTVLSII